MRKLSKTQLSVLRRLAQGEGIGTLTKGVRIDTLFKLEREGLIKKASPQWACVYAITDAGRDYLAGMRRGDDTE